LVKKLPIYGVLKPPQKGKKSLGLDSNRKVKIKKKRNEKERSEKQRKVRSKMEETQEKQRKVKITLFLTRAVFGNKHQMLCLSTQNATPKVE